MEILFLGNQIALVLATCTTPDLSQRRGQQHLFTSHYHSLSRVCISLLRTCPQAEVTQIRTTGNPIQTTDFYACLYLLSFRSALPPAETWACLVHLSHLCRKQAHFLANFNWFLFVFNHRLINILKRYQPNKLPRKKAETFLKRLCL